MLAISEAMHLSQSLGCERNLLRPEYSFDFLVNNGEITLARRHLHEFGIKGHHELRAAWACERYLQETTQIYARLNPEMKRWALEKIEDGVSLPKIPSWKQNKTMLEWLNSL
jgi:hypothetical protein